MKLPRNQKVFTLIVIIATPLVGTVSAHGASTALTMTVTSSTAPASLTISAPGALDLGTNVSFPSTIAKSFLSPVTVTDTRGSNTGWTSSVIISALTRDGGGLPIPSTVFSYATGAVTKVGTGTLTATDALTPGTSSNVVVATVVTGNVSGSWSPTITLTEPDAPATGSYAGTITSSVS